MASPIYDVLVIGAGLAGLRAATDLAKKGLKVVLVEARDRVGGRTYTITTPCGHTLDMGANWVGPTQDYVAELIKEFKLEVQQQFDEGKNILDLDGQLSVYEGNIGGLGQFGRPAEMDTAYALLDKLALEIDPLHPEKHPNSDKLDHTSYAQWIDQNIKNEGAKNLMKWFTKVCLAGEPSEVSLLFFLYFLRTGGGYQRLVNITDGAQQETIVGGSQQLSECMSRQLTSLGGKIALSSPIIFLNQSELTGTVTAETKNRQQFTAKYCICTVPTSLASRIHYDPPVAPLRDQLTQRMPMGCVIKIIVTYKTAWWRELGYSGEIVSDQEPIGLTYDKSSHDGKMHALVCFIAGKGARRWSEKTPEERKQASLAQLERCFKTEKARDITGYYEHDWSTEEFSRGCYLNFMTPGAMSDLAHHLRKPHGRIHWAGSETATKWMAYMDGALESGRRVANDVAEKLSQSSCSRSKAKL